MRPDRLITLGLFRPCRHALAGPLPARRLPVLMYHGIADDPEPDFSPYYKVCTSPRRFAAHLQWLADHGWRGVTLTDGLAALESNRAEAGGTEKRVAITFDDGFRDFFTAAFPLLRQHGFSATMYLPTDFIGDERRSFKGRECLTWAEVRELHGAGIEFGSHTVSHPELVRLDWPEIEAELRNSRATLESRLAAPVRAFAYPFAFPQADRTFVAGFRQVLRTTGYATCVTTGIGTVGPGDDALQLCRLPANDCDDDALFAAKLEGAYDWMGRPQRWFKAVKHRTAPRRPRPAI